ncbi:hypothetical protein LO772_08280 [Yinghuangia sp. ASG 101]|uniref:hypothetical protein n=1 Tax=Yinghuangia sp. ASG 101 TaxID=2896848 RepID=UPI001E33EE66|nr:hypothetical protein [Yinghuangia sp. ASG 101]UGQ13589.1 hypothetical protein LO772_08280 [Yinghuangia sp. ASG 101]
MFPDIQPLTAHMRRLGARLRELARDERGYSTETVLVTALLVALAIAVIAIIALKVTNKANSINLG